MGSALGAWKIKTATPAFRGSYGLNPWLFTGLHENPEDWPPWMRRLRDY